MESSINNNNIISNNASKKLNNITKILKTVKKNSNLKNKSNGVTYKELYDNIVDLFKKTANKNNISINDRCIYKYNYNNKIIDIILTYNDYSIDIKIAKQVNILPNKTISLRNTCVITTIYIFKLPCINNIDQHNCYNYTTIVPYFKIIYSFLMELNYYDKIEITDSSYINDIYTLPIRMLMNQGSIYSRFGFHFKNMNIFNNINNIKNYSLPYTTYSIHQYLSNYFNPKDLYNYNTTILMKYIKYYPLHQNITEFIDYCINILSLKINELNNTLNKINNKTTKNYITTQDKILSYGDLALQLPDCYKYPIPILKNSNNLKISIDNELNNSLKNNENSTNINKQKIIMEVNDNIQTYLNNNPYYVAKKILKDNTKNKYLDGYTYYDLKTKLYLYVNNSIPIEANLICDSIQNAYTYMETMQNK